MLSFIIRVIFYFQASLPLSIAHAFGRVVGAIFRRIPHNYSQALKTNIDLCLPELDPQQRDRFIRDTYDELGKGYFETGAILLWSPQRLLRLIVEIQGEDLVKHAQARGKGIIFAVPHLGCWELLGMYLPTLQTLTSMYRPIPLPAIDNMVKSSRQRAGNILVPTNNSGIRQLYASLKNNEAIVILPDQDPRLEGQVFAPLFGHLASTATLLPRLAAKTGASVLFVYCERLKKGYRVVFLQGEDAIGNADITLGASAMNRDIERCIRRIPTQYQWTYKRFKTRPPGEEKYY